MAANKDKRNIERQFYTENPEAEDENAERGKTFQTGNFVYIVNAYQMGN